MDLFVARRPLDWRRHKPRLWMLAGSLLLLSAVPAASQSAYYIRPGGTGDGTSPAKALGSIEQACDALRARSDASITGDITVNLLPGTYAPAAPLIFDNRDSGRNGHVVVYQSQQPARPAVWSEPLKLERLYPQLSRKRE